MKRLIVALAICLLFPALSFGAGSCIISNALFNSTGLTNPPNDVSGELYNNDRSVKRVTYLCTAHTDNTLSVVIDTKPLSGWSAKTFMVVPGSTAPTSDSDLALTGSVSGVAYITAATNGANVVDDTATRYDFFDNYDNDGVVMWGDDPVQVVLTNNAVASAKFYLVFTSIRSN